MKKLYELADLEGKKTLTLYSNRRMYIIILKENSEKKIFNSTDFKKVKTFFLNYINKFLINN